MSIISDEYQDFEFSEDTKLRSLEEQRFNILKRISDIQNNHPRLHVVLSHDNQIRVRVLSTRLLQIEAEIARLKQ